MSFSSMVYGLTPAKEPQKGGYDAVILGVKHKQFLDMGRQGNEKYLKPQGVFYDVKEVMR